VQNNADNAASEASRLFWFVLPICDILGVYYSQTMSTKICQINLLGQQVSLRGVAVALCALYWIHACPLSSARVWEAAQPVAVEIRFYDRTMDYPQRPH